MEEKINVKKFVDGYMKTKNKQQYLKKLTVVDYVGYERKMFLCQKIVDTTSYDKEKNIKIDSPSRYLVFVYTLLSTYTNLDLHGDSMLDDFNTLNKCGLIDEIVGLIKESEVKEFENVLSMTYEDFMTNHYEIHGFIENIIEKISNVIDGTSPQLLDELRGYLYANGEKRNE